MRTVPKVTIETFILHDFLTKFCLNTICLMIHNYTPINSSVVLISPNTNTTVHQYFYSWYGLIPVRYCYYVGHHTIMQNHILSCMGRDLFSILGGSPPPHGITAHAIMHYQEVSFHSLDVKYGFYMVKENSI